MIAPSYELLLVIKHFERERATQLATVRTAYMQGVGTKLGTVDGDGNGSSVRLQRGPEYSEPLGHFAIR